MTAATENQLIKDVADTRTDMAETRKQVQAMSEILIRREACAENCRKVFGWAFGNGKLGADEVLAQLQRAAAAAEEDAKHWRLRWADIVPGVVTGAVTGVIVILVGKLI